MKKTVLHYRLVNEVSHPLGLKRGRRGRDIPPRVSAGGGHTWGRASRLLNEVGHPVGVRRGCREKGHPLLDRAGIRQGLPFSIHPSPPPVYPRRDEAAMPSYSRESRTPRIVLEIITPMRVVALKDAFTDLLLHPVG